MAPSNLPKQRTRFELNLISETRGVRAPNAIKQGNERCLKLRVLAACIHRDNGGAQSPRLTESDQSTEFISHFANDAISRPEQVTPCSGHCTEVKRGCRRDTGVCNGG